MKRHPRVPQVPEQARALLERGRCKVYRFGVAWRVVGPGVDVLLADLAYLRAPDLEPLRDDRRARLAHLRSEA